MALTSAVKIFVDADEEINFVTEKVLAAAKDRVILVVPDNAMLSKGMVALRVLAKQIVNSDKLLVIVTEDQVAKNIAAKSGITAKSKVSEVTTEVWTAVAAQKKRELMLLKKHEQQLLADRQEGVSVNDTEPVVAENTSVQITEEVELGEVKDTAEEQADPAVVEEAVALPREKQRLKPRMLVEDDIELYVGGDIAEYGKDQADETEAEVELAEVPVGDGHTRQRIADTKVSFVGKDWGRDLPPARTKFLPSINFGTVKPAILNLAKRKGLVIALGLIVAFVFAIYFLTIRATVLVEVMLKQSDLAVSQDLKADTALKSINSSAKQIPAVEVKSEKITRSTSGTSTGKTSTGNKAKGLIDIYNRATKAIVLPAGTVISSVSTGLKYKTTVEASLVASSGPSSPGIVQDVQVEAETFGEKYNIPSSATNTQFVLDKPPAGSDLVAIRNGAREFSGGDSKEVVAVSQQDIDKAKTSLLPQIKEAGLASLNNSVPSGYILIKGTEQFNELEVSSLPKVNEEGSVFDLSASGETTGLALKLTDLIELLKMQATALDGQSGNLELGQSSEFKFESIVRQKGVASFKVSATAKLKNEISANSIHQLIAGNTVNGALLKVKSLEEVIDAKISYSWDFLPDFLKIVPIDPDQTVVKIATQKAQP